MSWYRLTLNSVQMAAGEAHKRKEAFAEAFAAARTPREMALFQKEREDGGNHPGGALQFNCPGRRFCVTGSCNELQRGSECRFFPALSARPGGLSAI